MNTAQLIGRLTRDPDISYTQKELCVARFSVAINRVGVGGADYISCAAFGKVAETVDKYVRKGDKVGITGHIQTGSYDKNGQKMWTTNVIVDRIEFLNTKEERQAETETEAPVSGFSKLTEEDIPF